MPKNNLQERLLREKKKKKLQISNTYLDMKTHYSTGYYDTDLVEALILWSIMVYLSTCPSVFHGPQMNYFFLYPRIENTSFPSFPSSVQGLPR